MSRYFIAAAALAVPAIAFAQTGERALLSHIENPTEAVTAIAALPGARYTLIQESADGERALAARVPAPAFGLAYFDVTVARSRGRAAVTGERALLGR